MALLSQIEVPKAQTSAAEPREEKLFLFPYGYLWPIGRHVIAWLLLVGAIKLGKSSFIDCLFPAFFAYLGAYTRYLKLSSEALSLYVYPRNCRLCWSEITSAEISEKRDKLIVYANFDKRIVVPSLNLNKPLLQRLLDELQKRGIEVTTTKRASYLQTKGTQFHKAKS